MKVLPSGAWRYALLIILLFAIVAVAAATIIDYLQSLAGADASPAMVRHLGVAIWALTMGCLFLAGGFGLWAIRSTAEVEGRRRVGRFVDAMDYLSDGLLALDRRGRIAGLNPAARRMAPRPIPAGQTLSLRDVFVCLSDEDVRQLLDPTQPNEVEAACVYPHGLRTLRFRSQPSESLALLLVSDITARHSQDLRRRQVAQLQVIGRIAAGVAHDFNNILCAVSGHAGLLLRSDLDPDTRRRSIAIVDEETRKGMHLSRQLLELSRCGPEDKPCDRLASAVADAAALLRIAISPAWTVSAAAQGAFPTVPLSTPQLVQVVLNLGLLVADAQPPGTVRITLDRPGRGLLLDVGDAFAAVILLAGEPAPDAVAAGDRFVAVSDEGGVISSVVRSIVEEAHGRLDQLRAADGLCLFRICLPHLDTAAGSVDAAARALQHPAEVLSAWRVLVGGQGAAVDPVAAALSGCGARLTHKGDLVGVLAAVERDRAFELLLLDWGMLGAEAEGLVKAIRALAPGMGIALCGAPPVLPWIETARAVAVSYDMQPADALLPALIRARLG